MIKAPVLVLLERHLVWVKTKYKNSSSLRLRYWRNIVETHPFIADGLADGLADWQWLNQRTDMETVSGCHYKTCASQWVIDTVSGPQICCWSEGWLISDYEKLPGIDSHLQTCQPSADWDLPARELLAECVPPCTASDSDNSDSEPTESQTHDRAQECIQELRTFPMHTGNTTFLDCVMDLQDMSHIKNEFITEAKQDKRLVLM